MNDEAFNISYALAKQLGSAYSINTNYGEIELDDELRAALGAALRPILERRLDQLECQGGQPQ